MTLSDNKKTSEIITTTAYFSEFLLNILYFSLINIAHIPFSITSHIAVYKRL